MTNGNETVQSFQDDAGGYVTGGLTKREHFAALALQGMLANDWQGYAKREEECDTMARCAVNYADALIAELNKPQLK